jgi:hypothetical protein
MVDEEIAKSAILETHGRRILEIARAWREMAEQGEQLASQLAQNRANKR